MVKKAAKGSQEDESEIIERALRSYFDLERTANSLREDLTGLAETDEEANAIAYAELKAHRAEQANKH